MAQGNVKLVKDSSILFKWGAVAVTLLGWVRVRESYWLTLTEPGRGAMMAHELTHLRQQQTLFFGLDWYLKYALSKPFRFSQEAEAYATEIMWKHANDAAASSKDALLNEAVSAMASPTYFGMCTEPEAKAELRLRTGW